MRIATILVNQEGEEITNQISISDTGMMRCEDDNTSWCTHVEFLMGNNPEGNNVPWDVIEKTGNEDAFQINIPMIPSLGIYVQVLFIPERLGRSSTVNALRCEYVDSKSLQNHLGYLNPCEGLYVVRSMLVQDFEAHKFDKVQCSKSSHSFSAQVQWDKDMASSPTGRFKQLYSVWRTGMCNTCLIGNTEDFSDLIPELEHKSRKPW